MKRLLLCILMLFLVACSDPKSTALPKDPAQWDAALKETVQKLSEEDKKLLAAYMLRKKMSAAFGGSDIPDGMTIGKAIDEQKQFFDGQKAKNAETAALKERVESEAAALKEQLDKVMTLAVLDVTINKANFRKQQYSDQIVFSVALENKGERDIDGVVGRVVFTDMFGKDVAFQMFKFEHTFKAGTTTQWKANRDFNEFNSNDKMLATLRKGKYTTRFIPEAVVFSDGTKLSVSQN